MELGIILIITGWMMFGLGCDIFYVTTYRKYKVDLPTIVFMLSGLFSIVLLTTYIRKKYLPTK
jgi:uncharacterized membrane protein YdcZ (DUF606 family)